MAETLSLTVQRRPSGRAAARALRRQGFVPGILYGSGITPIPIAARLHGLRPVLTSRGTHIIRLSIEGEAQTYECILKDTAFDPVTDAPIHFDLQLVTAHRPVEVEVPVILTGTPVGVTKGGILEHFIHALRIECLPKDLPEHIPIDISGLEIGQSLHVRDLSFSTFRILEHPDTVIVTVVAPKVSAEETAGGAS
jgi:large subunit ribosomal protein L25